VLHYANELLVCVRLSFQTLLQIGQVGSTFRDNIPYEKTCLGKESRRVFVADKNTDEDKPHYDLFFTTISTSKKRIFSERELKKALHNTLTRAAWYGLLTTMTN